MSLSFASGAGCVPFHQYVDGSGCPQELPAWGVPTPRTGDEYDWWRAGWGWINGSVGKFDASTSLRVWPTETAWQLSLARYDRLLAPLLPPRDSVEARELLASELEVNYRMEARRDDVVTYLKVGSWVPPGMPL